jgi:hypothetical protein
MVQVQQNVKKPIEGPEEAADVYSFDVVNEGVDRRLKFFNMCCSVSGCK